MTDIDDIRKTIDGLYAKATPTACSPKAEDALILSIAAHWPTISAALAEAETIRRKAKAFDAIAAESVHGIRDENGEWRVYRDADFNASLPHATGPDLLRAIEAALAAKEQSQ